MSPFDVDLNDELASDFVNNPTFCEALFKQVQSHPLDTHPTLRERLLALNQDPDKLDLKSVFETQTEPYSSLGGDNRLFDNLLRKAHEYLDKVQKTAEIVHADEQTSERKDLLATHFPDVNGLARVCLTISYYVSGFFCLRRLYAFDWL